MSTKTNISEIFSSIQGEGLYVGERHIFVRFCGCNLVCDYCDTKENQNSQFGTEYSTQDVISKIKDLTFPNNLHTAVVLTGGEPLLAFEFIKELSPKLQELGFDVYLETNGTLDTELSKVLDVIDIIACDFKLDKKLWNKHEIFLSKLLETKKMFFLKIVVTEDCDNEIILASVDFLKSFNAGFPIVLQPVMKENVILTKIEFIEEFQKQLLNIGLNALIIPQIHKILKVR